MEPRAQQEPTKSIIIKNVPDNLTETELARTLNNMGVNFDDIQLKKGPAGQVQACVEFLNASAAAEWMNQQKGVINLIPEHQSVMSFAVVVADRASEPLWSCPCGALNVERRVQCFKCNVPRPLPAGRHMPVPPEYEGDAMYRHREALPPFQEHRYPRRGDPGMDRRDGPGMGWHRDPNMGWRGDPGMERHWDLELDRRGDDPRAYRERDVFPRERPGFYPDDVRDRGGPFQIRFERPGDGGRTQLSRMDHHARQRGAGDDGDPYGDCRNPAAGPGLERDGWMRDHKRSFDVGDFTARLDGRQREAVHGRHVEGGSEHRLEGRPGPVRHPESYGSRSRDRFSPGRRFSSNDRLGDFQRDGPRFSETSKRGRSDDRSTRKERTVPERYSGAYAGEEEGSSDSDRSRDRSRRHAPDRSVYGRFGPENRTSSDKEYPPRHAQRGSPESRPKVSRDELNGGGGGTMRDLLLAKAGKEKSTGLERRGVEDGSDQIGRNPCNTVLLRGLDALTDESKLLDALADVTSLVPKGVYVMRHLKTNASLGFAFMEFDSIVNGTKVVEFFNNQQPLEVDGKLLVVDYSKHTFRTIMAGVQANKESQVSVQAEAEKKRQMEQQNVEEQEAAKRKAKERAAELLEEARIKEEKEREAAKFCTETYTGYKYYSETGLYTDKGSFVPERCCFVGHSLANSLDLRIFDEKEIVPNGKLEDLVNAAVKLLDSPTLKGYRICCYLLFGITDLLDVKQEHEYREVTLRTGGESLLTSKLHWAVRTLKEKNVMTVLCTFPPMSFAKHNQFLLRNGITNKLEFKSTYPTMQAQLNEQVANLNRKIEELNCESGVITSQLSAKLFVMERNKYMLKDVYYRDGLHPTSQGATLLNVELAQNLRKAKMGKRSPDWLKKSHQIKSASKISFGLKLKKEETSNPTVKKTLEMRPSHSTGSKLRSRSPEQTRERRLPSSRGFNRSPKSHNRSPDRYGRSPRRYSQSPRRSRSPRERGRSPRKRSRSPGRRNRSPKRRNYSPKRRSRSPGRWNRSPRRHSQSPKKLSSSAGRYEFVRTDHGYRLASGEYSKHDLKPANEPEYQVVRVPKPFEKSPSPPGTEEPADKTRGSFALSAFLGLLGENKSPGKESASSASMSISPPGPEPDPDILVIATKNEDGKQHGRSAGYTNRDKDSKKNSRDASDCHQRSHRHSRSRSGNRYSRGSQSRNRQESPTKSRSDGIQPNSQVAHAQGMKRGFDERSMNTQEKFKSKYPKHEDRFSSKPDQSFHPDSEDLQKSFGGATNMDSMRNDDQLLRLAQEQHKLTGQNLFGNVQSLSGLSQLTTAASSASMMKAVKLQKEALASSISKDIEKQKCSKEAEMELFEQSLSAIQSEARRARESMSAGMNRPAESFPDKPAMQGHADAYRGRGVDRNDRFASEGDNSWRDFGSNNSGYGNYYGGNAATGGNYGQNSKAYDGNVDFRDRNSGGLGNADNRFGSSYGGYGGYY